MLIVALVLAVVVWVAVGAVLARREGVHGTAALPIVARGPWGLLDADGRDGSSRAGSDPATYYDDLGDDLEMPVLVDVDGEWCDGVLQAWTTDDAGWQALVDYERDGTNEQAWFGERSVRPRPDAGSD